MGEAKIRPIRIPNFIPLSLKNSTPCSLVNINVATNESKICPSIMNIILLSSSARHKCAVSIYIPFSKMPCTTNSNKKTKIVNDLFLAPNPQNSYPVFQIFQKSENFSLNELNQALIFFSDLDYRLKSTSFDAKTAIENFIIKICSKGGFERDTEKY